jgi:hypothetical protein
MNGAERHMRPRHAHEDGLSLIVVGKRALILLGDMVSDTVLIRLCVTCKHLSPKYGEGLCLEVILRHRTSVLDGLTALINTSAITFFASAENRMLSRFNCSSIVWMDWEGGRWVDVQEPSTSYRFFELYAMLRTEEQKELFEEFNRDVVVPAEVGLKALERYTKDCAIVGSNPYHYVRPSIYLQVKGSYQHRRSTVAAGFRTLQDENSFEGFLRGVSRYVRPELRPQSAGRPTWTKSLAIIKEGGTCSNEAKDNTVELLYSGLVFPLYRIMDQDQVPLDIEQQAHPCWWTISTPVDTPLKRVGMFEPRGPGSWGHLRYLKAQMEGVQCATMIRVLQYA